MPTKKATSKKYSWKSPAKKRAKTKKKATKKAVKVTKPLDPIRKGREYAARRGGRLQDVKWQEIIVDDSEAITVIVPYSMSLRNVRTQIYNILSHIESNNWPNR